MGVTGAVPDRLCRYAARAGSLDESLRRVASGVAVPEVAAVLRGLAEREEATTRWVGAVGEAFRRADAAEGPGGGRWIAGAIADAMLALGPDGDPDVAAAALGAMAAAGSPPSAVAALAELLGPVALARLARARPELVGPLDGMPLATRYAANRRLVRAAAGATDDPVRRARLAALLRPDPGTGRPRQLLLFDGTGDGRVAEVLGDPATASTLVVLVPGAGTDLDDFDRTVSRPAADVVERVSVSGPTVAAVAWLGYDPPDTPGADAGIRELGDLVSTRRATEGGASLQRLLEALPAAPGQRRTLVGHSYGSTTVAAALLAGAAPDHVVVMGSPGVLVDRAADFERAGTTFHVLAAPGDPVVALARLGRFGGDPAADGSGFEPLATGVRGHDRYLEPGSASLANVAAVVAGTEVRRAGAPG